MSPESNVQTIMKQFWEINHLPPVDFMNGITYEIFLEILDIYILTKSTKKPKRMTYFFMLVLQAIENNIELIVDGMKYLTEYIDVKNKTVRRNVIVILGILSDKIDFKSDQSGKLVIPNYDNLDDEIDGIVRKIAERLFDMDKSVRMCAIQILSNFKSFFVNHKTTVRRIFKDILRHDPSEDVRNCVMKYFIDESCTVEKINDQSLMIRKNFFLICFPHIKIREIQPEHRLLILEKCLTEREFAALPYLKDKIYEEYDLPKELVKLVEDFFVVQNIEFDSATLNQIEENRKNLNSLLFEIFNDLFATVDDHDKNTSQFYKTKYYENLEINSALLLYSFLSYKESVSGRESLQLVEFGYFSKILHMKVKDIAKGSQTTSDLYYLIILFQLTLFYDICDADTSKQVLAVVYKFLKLPVFKNAEIMNKFIENSIILANATERSSFIAFCGSLIGSNEDNLEFLLSLCKFIMMRVTPLESIHFAIIDEKILPNISKSEHRAICFETLFFFIVSKYREDPDAFNSYENLELSSSNPIQIFNLLVSDPNCQNISIFSDLFLLMETHRIHLYDRILNHSNSASDILKMVDIVPLSKCLLIEPEKFYEVFEKLVLTYFRTIETKAQQYLTIFLQQFTLRNPDLIISKFMKIVQLLDIKSAKIYIDQTLLWIKTVEGAQNRCLRQDFLFNSIISFLQNVKKIQKLAETDGNKKKSGYSEQKSILEFVIQRIEVNSSFSSKRIKQLMYCLGIIAKLTHILKENVSSGELGNKLLVFNDNTPISPEQQAEVDELLK